MNEGLIRLKVLDTKRAQQEQLLARGREQGDDSYQKAFDQIRSIVEHRRPALYHQQAIQEALVTGLDFMRIPNTSAMLAALKSKDKAQIKAAADSLKKTLKSSSENRARISWDLTGWYCSNIPSQTDCCRPPLLWQTPTRITMPHTKYG